MCIACDVPMAVASVAAALELPGISIESARLATDKLAMKERFSRWRAHSWFSPVDSAKVVPTGQQTRPTVSYQARG